MLNRPSTIRSQGLRVYRRLGEQLGAAAEFGAKYTQYGD